jgi:AcrR family transcriptional regulator
MSQRRTGPVRSEAARRAVLEATARQFALRGYERLTIEGVAADAGTSKQTIYRWWESKAALVADCLLEGLLFPQSFQLGFHGGARQDLVDWIDSIFAATDEPSHAPLLRSAVAAAAEYPEVGDRLWDALDGAGSFEKRLRAAVADGELLPTTPVTAIRDAMVGAITLRALGGVPGPRVSAAELVDAVLAGHWTPRQGEH